MTLREAINLSEQIEGDGFITQIEGNRGSEEHSVSVRLPDVGGTVRWQVLFAGLLGDECEGLLVHLENDKLVLT